MFYYLVFGAEDELLKRLGLNRNTNYRYLQHDAPRVSDAAAREQLTHVRNAMDLFEFSPVDQANAFAVIAAVLLIGQVSSSAIYCNSDSDADSIVMCRSSSSSIHS